MIRDVSQVATGDTATSAAMQFGEDTNHGRRLVPGRFLSVAIGQEWNFIRV